MKVLITGGHITPALALIDELQERKNTSIVVVGRDSDFERQSVERRAVSFITLKTGKLDRSISLKTAVEFLRIPGGLVHATAILKKEQPDVICSFGGHIGFAISLAASLLKIPLVIHEQTLVPGLTSKVTSRIARKTFVSFPDAVSSFSKEKTIVSGNPIRKAVFADESKPFSIISNKPVLYITGGSLGSVSLNKHIEQILSDLLKTFVVIHQTGILDRQTSQTHEDYFVRSHIQEDEIGFVYKVADLVVCRAGANTISELIALEKPAVLVPLPWSAGGEQQEHARLLADGGVGESFDQSESSSHLLELIHKVAGDLSTYKKNYSKLHSLYKSDAARTIADSLYEILPTIKKS